MRSSPIIGQRTGHDIGMPPAEHAPHPLPEGVSASVDIQHQDSRTLNQQAPQVLSPRLLMPSRDGLPPVLYCRGTNTTDATNCRARQTDVHRPVRRTTHWPSSGRYQGFPAGVGYARPRSVVA